MGWKYIIVFVFWDAFEAVVWYFFCVETVGYTLEELDQIFSASNPVNASVQKKKVFHHIFRVETATLIILKVVIKKTGDILVLDE